MIATSGFVTALECTKFVFGRGSAPGSLCGSRPLAGLRGPTSQGEEGNRRNRRRCERDRTGKTAPAVRAYSVSPKPLAGLKGTTSKG